MENSLTAGAANCSYDTPALALDGGKIVLALTGGDPTGTGFFCIDALTAEVAAAPQTGLLPQGSTGPLGYPLPFNVTTLTFNLGATLVQQVPETGAIRVYEEGDYTGKIGMEVIFK